MTAHSHPPANRSMPPGTIIPELAYADVAAAAVWLCDTFGFQERLRIGAHRCQLTFGGASIVVTALPANAEPRPAVYSTHSIMVRVADADRHCAHARQRGARIINPPTDYPFGERQYTVEDPSGRRWTFSQSIADVDPGDWGGLLLEGKNNEE